MNKLVEIPLKEWSNLRDLYINRKDRASCYNSIQTFINWLNKEPKFPLKIYSLNGDWQTDGTFVAEFFNQIFCNTCSDNKQRLLEALNCLIASKNHLIAGFQECVLPTVEQHFLDSGLKIEEVFHPTGTMWYHVSKEQALNFKIDTPDNVCLKPLEECHAETVNSIWPHRSPGSVEFVKMLIRFNDSVGVFEDNNLVAWCLILPLGALGLLQVLDTHKRKGYGNLAVRYMSKLLAEKNIEVTAPVVFENAASRSMFEKLGFKIIDKVYWAEKPANV